MESPTVLRPCESGSIWKTVVEGQPTRTPRIGQPHSVGPLAETRVTRHPADGIGERRPRVRPEHRARHVATIAEAVGV